MKHPKRERVDACPQKRVELNIEKPLRRKDSGLNLLTSIPIVVPSVELHSRELQTEYAKLPSLPFHHRLLLTGNPYPRFLYRTLF